ncbi:hypothetical protein [Lysobacter sp. M2-1]|uniref:hypothetical protein n=1 Tax=Lysobacter sp. M2-1 TaxID=2916839 RepID=UPI001F57481A|nr:hypothetical protein [Lysobacter sp. M2-1]
MSQNLLSLTLTDDQLTAINNALTALEAATTGLIAMDNATRRQLTREIGVGNRGQRSILR